MEHLSLEIFDRTGTGSSYMALEPDASITIVATSPIFAKGDVWSFPFTLNAAANAHIFGTAGDIHGARLHEQLHNRRARLWVEGLPLYLGYLKLGTEATVDGDGNIDVTFESGRKTFEDMVDGAKANQVPMMGDVLIGLALWRKRWSSCTVNLQAAPVLGDGLVGVWSDVFIDMEPHSGTAGTHIAFSADGEEEGSAVQEYPRMVYPKLDDGAVVTEKGEQLTAIDCINTDNPYSEDDNGTPTHPYCHTALCYQRYGYERKDKNENTTIDYSAEPEAQRGYEYMPANRLNSAPNFYVIYWIRCLMKHLGILVEENQMMGVEDLRRLFFVNTDCAYMEPQKLRTAEDFPFGRYKFGNLHGRSGAQTRDIGRLVPEFFGVREGETTYTFRRGQNVSVEDSGFKCTSLQKISEHIDSSPGPILNGIAVKVKEVEDWTDAQREAYEEANGYLHKAYATSECFPDADISEVVKALESGFGIRLVFSDDYSRVRIVLLRNIFRSRDVQEIACDITAEEKVENPVRGFRMTYGDIDDTAFRYKGFDDLLPKKAELWKDESDKHDYSQWKLDAVYAGLIKEVSAFDKTCYVTPRTGNAYGIKIDKDAKLYNELHPALFEYAGFMDAEDGDCTGDEETIETVTVGFKPAIMNDLNMEEERSDPSAAPRYALFVDEKMRPRRPRLAFAGSYDDPSKEYPMYGRGGLYGEDSPASGMKSDDGIVKPGEFAIRSDMYGSIGDLRLRAKLRWALGPILAGDWWNVRFNIEGHLNEGYRLYLQDNYEPNDNGVSPVETHDWGLILGIMRGSGSDAYVRYSPDPDDFEGNDTWEARPGSNVTAHPDTCDTYGNLWDYNGSQAGVGSKEGRVSLKLRAEKPNPKFDPTKPESATNKRYLEVLKDDGKTKDPDLSGRGLCDQFYKEYSYWVRNARIWKGEGRMELAQLLAMDMTKKVAVGDVTGFVRKAQYTVSNKTGLGMVTMEIMYI